MPLPKSKWAPSYNRSEDSLATTRRPRNLPPATKPNPLRDLVTQKSRASEAVRERRRVQELKSELPSIIQERVGEQIQKLENRLLTEVKEIGQKAIEESTAAISEQLSGRIETLEKVSEMQTQTLATLRDSSEIAERKVSQVVDQIEKSLASVVPGFELEPRKLPPEPEKPAPTTHQPTVIPSAARVVTISPGIIEHPARIHAPADPDPEPEYLPLAIQRLKMPKMPPMAIADRFDFSNVGVSETHPQFLPKPAEIVKAEPADISEIVGKYGFCPNCTSTDVRRAYRRGLFEEFLRLFFIAPFRCRSCLHKFYRF
jgi:hypothetical protein